MKTKNLSFFIGGPHHCTLLDLPELQKKVEIETHYNNREVHDLYIKVDKEASTSDGHTLHLYVLNVEENQKDLVKRTRRLIGITPFKQMCDMFNKTLIDRPSE